jgi:hypothetical protein
MPPHSSLIAATILLAAGCTIQNNPVVPTTGDAPEGVEAREGFVSGRVVDEEGRGLGYQFVSIFGSNFVAFTDSAGNFTLYNIPAGTYRLAVEGTTVDVAVTAGDTTVLADMVVPTPQGYGKSATGVVVDKIEVCHRSEGEELIWVGRGSDLDMRSPLELDADSLSLRCVVAQVQPTAPTAEYVPVESRTTVTHNGEALYDGVPPKGRVSTSAIAPTGSDTFTIAVDGLTCARAHLCPVPHRRQYSSGTGSQESSPGNHREGGPRAEVRGRHVEHTVRRQRHRSRKRFVLGEL